MVLNNVTKFHKILIKSIRLRERTLFGQTYIQMDRGNTQCPGHCHGGCIKRPKISFKDRLSLNAG